MFSLRQQLARKVPLRGENIDLFFLGRENVFFVVPVRFCFLVLGAGGGKY